VCTYESVTAKYVGRHLGVSSACRKYCISTSLPEILDQGSVNVGI